MTAPRQTSLPYAHAVVPDDKAETGRKFRGPARMALIGFGWFNVMLGLAGAFLPLMPTTVFLLIALWCFMRSSPRFAAWLYDHQMLGLTLRRWQEERIVPLKAKFAAFLSISASLAMVHGFYPDMGIARWLVTGICVAVLIFLVTRPHESSRVAVAESD